MSATLIELPGVLASPHAHGGESVRRVMRRVQLALAPATLFAFWLFGWPAINLFFLTIGSCLLFELICQRLRGLPSTLGDGSALLTGWLLALTLPPWAPWWAAASPSSSARRSLVVWDRICSTPPWLPVWRSSSPFLWL